jgi:putative cell wall-binding protein
VARSLGSALVVFALSVFGVASAPVIIPAAGADALTIHSPAPAPGELVAAGTVRLAAWVSGDHAGATAWFHVDGVAHDAGTATAGDRGTHVDAHVLLEPGVHDVRLEVLAADGTVVERSWRVSATDRAVQRLSGADRVATAVAISRATLPRSGEAEAAVLARADDFADALAGAPLATHVAGPLLLAHRTSLPPAAAEELTRVLAPRATVHLLGGDAALSRGVAAEVAELGFRVVRHAGPDRFATAAAIAGWLPRSDTAILASGLDFPDALAASAPAARDGIPILLTAPRHLPEPTRAALDGRASVTVAGGTAAVGEEVAVAVAELVADVRRVAGPDRYATAAAIVDAFYDGAEGVSLASGTAFPDALAGTRHAVALDQPLLLTAASSLPAASADRIRRLQPDRVTVYGGAGAVSDHVVSTAVRAAYDGPAGVRMLTSAPDPLQVLGNLETVTVGFDRPVDAGRSSVHVEVAGAEVRGSIAADGHTLRFTVEDPRAVAGYETPWPGRVVLSVAGTDGAIAHHDIPFTYRATDPVYALAGPVPLHLPSRAVDMIGFHESMHPGAQAQSVRPTSTPKTTLPSRRRGTAPTSASDVVVDPAQPVLAPASGTVIRAGTYVLYCRYTDEFAVIAPDAHADWEVKVLHVRGLHVRVGDRVIAGETILAGGPRQLPFASQVDDYSSTRWPHVHVEVVDPSIPPRPGGGC